MLLSSESKLESFLSMCYIKLHFTYFTICGRELEVYSTHCLTRHVLAVPSVPSYGCNGKFCVPVCDLLHRLSCHICFSHPIFPHQALSGNFLHVLAVPSCFSQTIDHQLDDFMHS